MMENIEKEKILNDENLKNVSGGVKAKTKRGAGNATKICHACQLRVDAKYTECPYCGGKLSEE